jgi:hypothetical protein
VNATVFLFFYSVDYLTAARSTWAVWTATATAAAAADFNVAADPIGA